MPLRKLFQAFGLVMAALSPALGQPVLNEQYHPQPGSRFTYVDASDDTAAFRAIPQGAGQSWDFSGLSTTGWTRAGVVSVPLAGQGGGFFPTANRVLTWTRSTQVTEDYFRTSSLGAYALGSSAPGAIISIQPGQATVPDGLAFGQAATQQVLEKSFEIGGADTMYLRRRETMRYAGFGTLRLPGGAVYSNAVQLLLRTRNDMGLSAAGPYFFSDSVVTYRWLVPGLGTPVLEYTHNYSALGVEYDAAFYLRNTVVGTRPGLAVPRLAVAPLPASSMVSLLFPAGEVLAVAAVLDNQGRRVAAIPVTNGRINVAGLPPGIYTLEVEGMKTTYRARLVKE